MKPFDRSRPFTASRHDDSRDRTNRKRNARSPLLLALEPRFLLDAAVVATGAEAAADQAAQQAAAQMAQSEHDGGSHDSDGNDHLAAEALAIAPGGERREIVFIDGNVRNYQQLVAGLAAGTEVVVLDGSRDGLQQMADYLQGRSDIDAIHILSHGDAGKIQLGNQWIGSDQLEANADLLAAIGTSLSDDGDILLYGCNVGADTVGIDFIGSLAAATGADVAASGDATGAAVLGGDWVLEATRGSIETVSLNIGSYSALLAAFSDDMDGSESNSNTFIRTLGGVSFTYTFTNEGDGPAVTGGLSYESQFGAGNSASMTLLSATPNLGTTERVTITRTDLADFTFNGIYLDNPNPESVTVAGYLDGVLVSSQSFGTGTTTLNFGGIRVDEVRITSVDFYGVAIDNFAGDTDPPNTAPTITNLNGDNVSWAGAGNTVTLDVGGNASFTDAELMALNGGNGNWAGASLTVQHPTSPIAADIFGFNTAGALFTVSGNNLQAGDDTFATFTNAGGVLTVSFTSSVTAATTALVNDVAQRITYRNDTPAGDATIRFALNDGTDTVTADVTVTSNTIYVTNATDTTTIDRSNGVSFSEAIAIAAADVTGSQTIIFSSALASQTLSLSGNVSINETLTLNLDAASGVTLTGGSLSIGGGSNLIITNGAGDTATIATTLAGSGNLTMFGGGTLTLSGNNSYTGTTNVAAGTLSIGSDSNLGSGTVNVTTRLQITGTTTIDNDIALLSFGEIDTSATTTLSGVVSGSWQLLKFGAGTLILSGNNTYTGTTSVMAGTLQVTGSTASATIVNSGTTLAGTGTLGGNVTVNNGGTLAPGNGGAGALTINGNLTMNAGSTLAVEINGTTAGSSYDQVIVNGTVNVSNTTIAATHGYVPGSNDSYRIIDNDLADAVTGTFSGVAESGTLTAGGNGTVLTASYAGGTGNDITLTAVVNEAPVIGNLNGDGVSYVEGLSPIRLDAGSNATLTDTDSANFDGGNVTVTFTANHVPGEDVLSIIHTGTGAGQIGIPGSTVLYGGVVIGTYAGGTGNDPLVITLNANSTPAAVQALLRNLAYINGNNTDPSTSARSVSITVNDGDGGTSASATVSVSVTSVNDAPTITATGNNPTYTENGSAVDLFSHVSISTVEAGQTITGMTLTVTNLADGSDEILRIDGTDIALLNGSNGTTAGNGISYSISLVGGTATVTLSSAGGISTATAQTVVDGMSYRNSGDAPSTATRVITLTSITDSGGTANGGVDTTATSIATSVSVIAVNDAPIVTSGGGSSTFTEGGIATVIDSGLTLSDPDNGTLPGATVSITGNFQLGADVLIFVNDGSTMGNITASYDAGTGVLTLTSAGATATLAQWQAALRSVTYSNGSDAPGTANRTISFIANDGQDDSTGATKIVSVTAVNDAPQITAPATIGVTEDMPSAITGISFSDVDAGSANVTVTLSIGSGTLSAASGGGVTVGGTASALTLTGSIADINSFIAGSNLSFTTAANATADVTLTVNINDGGNTGSGGAENASETITLQVAAVNDAPTITAPGSIAITEDIPGALTGISFTDVDAGSGNVTVTFSVPSGTLSATSGSGVTVGGTASARTLTGSLADINAFIAASGISFTTASNATANVTLTVTIDDGSNTGSGGAQTDTTTVTLTVTAVNDAPVNSIPTAQDVDQDDDLVFNSGNGNLISISDVDAGASDVEVTLAATNGLLTLSGTSGLVFSVSDGTSDATMTFTGSIADINNALNGLVFSPTGGYNGPASLQITTNDLGNSGSGGPQTDTDTISITVNSLIPYVTDVSASTADGLYKVGDTITITATFSEAVTVDTTGGIPTLLLETGSVDRLATYVSGSGGNTLTFIYTVQPGDLSADLNYQTTAALSLNGATIRNASNDAALTLPSLGDANSLAGNKAIVIDGVAPLVGSVSVPADGTYVAGQDLDFTVNLSESVTVDTSGGTPRIAITLDTGGTVYADYLSGSGTSALLFRLTVASGQADSNGITVGNAIQANGGSIRDTAGNDIVAVLNSIGATGDVRVDALPPTATITVANTQLDAGQSTTVTIVFSEAVTGLSLDDFSVDNGTLSNLTTSDGGTTWTATLTPLAGVADASNLIALDNTAVTDAAGNAGTGTTLSNNYAIDSTPLGATIAVADTALIAGETSTVTIVFSKAVGSLSPTDFTVDNGVLGNLSSNDGGITWTATLTPTANIEDSSNVIALRLGGNPIATSNAYAIDTLRPGATITLDDTALTTGDTATVTIAFTEAVTGLTLDDFSVQGGALSDLVSSDGGRTWSATLTPAANSESSGNRIALNLNDIADAAGNRGDGSVQSDSYAIDTSAPRYTIAAGTSSGGEVQFTVTFSEPVDHVDAGDFALQRTANVSGDIVDIARIDDRNWVVTVGGVTGAGTLTLDVTSTSDIADRAGNPLASGSGASHTVTLPPPPPLPEPPPPISTGIGSQFTVPSLTGNFEVPSLAAPAPLLTVTGSASNGLLAGFASPATGGNALGTSAPPSLVTAPLVSGNGSIFTAASEAPGLTPPNNLTLPLDTMSANFIQTGESTSGSGLQATPDLGRHAFAAGQPLTVTLPRGTFTHDDASALITVEVRLKDGRPLPNWLRFDPRTGTLSGQPPAGYRGTLQIELTGRDSRGNRVSSSLQIDVRDTRPPQAEHAPVTIDRFTALWQALGRERAEIDSHERAEIDGIDTPSALPGFAAQLAAEASAVEREAARLADALQRHLADA